MARFYPEVYDLQPWYHDFSELGLQTRFTVRRRDQLSQLFAPLRRKLDPGYVEKGERFSLRSFLNPAPASHSNNQRRKEAIILPYIHHCLLGMPDHPQLNCLDLFCADGYYSCMLANMRLNTIITGVDLDATEVRRAKLASRLLNVTQAKFIQADVWNFVLTAGAYDLVLCTGGLYHLTDPCGFIQLLHKTGSRHLVVQSVVTLETDAPNYFVSPAPGWRHGSRFTHAGLGRWLTEAGWRILECATNELDANTRLCDRGFSYYHCEAVV